MPTGGTNLLVKAALACLECRRLRNEWGHTFTFGGFERCELDRASAAHPKCCCASCIAGTPLNGGSQGLLFCGCRFRTEECSSMRVHIDWKPPDGNAIAFVVIILLSVIALEVLFSRLDTFL